MKCSAFKFAGVVLAALMICHNAFAAERILSFDSIVQVNRDGSMRVTELIRVRAENRRIQRGIYRDFPTKYKDRHGVNYVVDFEVLAVTRNGRPEPFFTRPLKNGVRTYIGNKGVYLKPGEYTYALTYRTNRQLGFFENHDELYWNVTGNGWSFPIDHAIATVILPPGVPMDTVRHEAYTGPQGAKGTDYTSGISKDDRVVFETTRPLNMREGLTIVTIWPKGFVREPDFSTRAGWFFDDNAAFLTGAGGVLLLLLFYGFAWRAVGKDPEKGVIFPHYEPPKGFSPASMRFIKKMGYDPKTFATALVNLAVKGYVKIREEDHTYTIERIDRVNGSLAPGESVLLRKLLVDKVQKLDNEDHAHIKKALKAHEKSLRNNYERLYFNSNLQAFIVGGLITAGVFFSVIMLVSESLPSAIFGVVALVMLGIGGGRGIRDMSTKLPSYSGSKSIVGLLALIISSVSFLALFAFAYFFLEALIQDPWARAGMLLLGITLIVINALFYQLMKAPTLRGRKLLDRVDGFEEYLKVAEEEDLKLRNPPKKTPQLFEKYLPYAMALDVEDLWGEKFAAVLDAARRERAYTEPSWYHGSHWHSSRGPAGFASAMAGSLAVSAAAASSPPGGSGGSGGGGGGSSGGGGGGGGGGGW